MAKEVADWDELLSSISRLQGLIPDAVLVGGAASIAYAKHRLSTDHDHVLPDLKDRFEAILMQLEAVAGWKTARVNRPVLILGSLDGVETGVRQLVRTAPLETCVINVSGVDLTVPTLEVWTWRLCPISLVRMALTGLYPKWIRFTRKPMMTLGPFGSKSSSKWFSLSRLIWKRLTCWNTRVSRRHITNGQLSRAGVTPYPRP